MYNKRLTRALQGLAVSSAVAWAPMAAAIDWTFSGFVRQEAAYKLGSGDENFWNQGGNLSLIHISEPTRPRRQSRNPASA